MTPVVGIADWCSRKGVEINVFGIGRNLSSESEHGCVEDDKSEDLVLPAEYGDDFLICLQ